MDQQPPARHIQHPILDNARSGVKSRFRGEVKVQARIGDFYYQAQVLGPRVSGSKVLALSLQHDDIRFWFVRWIVFRRNIDRRCVVHKSKSKNLRQAFRKQCQ